MGFVKSVGSGNVYTGVNGSHSKALLSKPGKRVHLVQTHTRNVRPMSSLLSLSIG